MQVLALLNDSTSSNHNRIESLLNPTTTTITTAPTKKKTKKNHPSYQYKESTIAAFYSSASYSPDRSLSIPNSNDDAMDIDITDDFDDADDMETEVESDEHSEYYNYLPTSEIPTSSTSPRFYLGRRRVVPAHRLAQSRLIGHRHRANEKIRTEQLDVEVAILSEQNLLLRKQLAAAAATHGLGGAHLPGSGIDVHSDSGKILGVSNVSPKSVLLLIELIALRRNLIQNNVDIQQLQATSVECPSQLAIDAAIRISDLKNDMSVLKMHERWCDYEKFHAVSKFLMPLEEKRCTRCRKLRNGHPRSHCDDGFKVGSQTLYQDAYQT